MKTKLFLFITLFIFNRINSQVNLVLSGNCSTQGVYQINWADENFWNGSGSPQTWGTPNMLNHTNSVTGDMVIVEGIYPAQHGNCLMDMACSSASAFTNLPDINGKIAIVRRGQCEFSDKALAVQQAGAIACIIINTSDTTIDFIGSNYGPNVFIPTIMVSSSAGIAICDAINQGCLQAYIGDPLLTPGYNSITGNVLFDVNGDNCATSTLNVLNIYPVSSTDGVNTFTSVSNIPQNYLNYVNIGTYTTSVLNLPSYLDAVPNQDVVTFTTDGNSHTADFCIVPNQTINDVNITFIPNYFTPGFAGYAWLTYQNVGTTIQNGVVTLNFDDNRLDFISASDPVSSQTTGQITFNYSNLMPYETRTILVNFDVLNPPINIVNDLLNFNGQITPISGDNTPLDNSFSLDDTIIGAFDPNDISVLEGGAVNINNSDNFLHYLVRFQNTGTAPAVNVVVKELLDPNLDWSTLQILESSHPMSVSMVNDSVDFKFYNIYLPDSTSDEAGSHGYLIYKIKPINSVVIGDQISAKVDIYFDFNAPVITNTVTTTFVDYINVTDINNSAINIYPNPVSDVIYIKSNYPVKSIKIYNQLGELITEKAQDNQINISQFISGIYFCKISDEDGNTSFFKIVKK
jgi:hypothetical protein